MALCERNSENIPTSGAALAGTDLIWINLPDGTTVFKTGSTILSALLPPDKELVVVPSGGNINATPGEINNLDATFTLSAFIGKRVRLWRNGILQGTSNTGGSYYTFNIATGEFTIIGAATTGETFIIQAY